MHLTVLCFSNSQLFHELNNIVHGLPFLLQDSTPRIVKFGDYPGCPCGGTHVADIADIGNLKVDSLLCPFFKKT